MRWRDLLFGLEPSQSSSGPGGDAAGPGVRAATIDINSPQFAEFVRGGPMSLSGVTASPATAMRIAAFNRCVRLKVDTLATMSVDIKERVSDKEVRNAPDHAVSKLLKSKPNGWQTPTEFKRFLGDSYLLRGNGYALKVGSRRRITELIPLHPDRVTVKQNRDLSLTYEYRRPNGGTMQIPQEEMFHLRGPSDDGVTGVSVVQYAANTIGLSHAMQRHNSNLFKNGAAISGTLSHPKSLGNPEQIRLRASIDEFAGGGEKAFKTLILEEGMKYDKMGMSSVDAQLLETIEATDAQIAMFFGVPPVMLGMTNKQTSFGAGIGQMGQFFIDYGLMPDMTLWDQTINRDLLGGDDPFYSKHNPASLLRGDIKERYAAYAVARQYGALNANEWREKEDMNPYEGGDKYWEPLNMAPVGSNRDASASSDQNSNDSGSQSGGNANE